MATPDSTSNGGIAALDLTQFYQVFFEEAAEHLAEMENLLLGLEPAEATDDELNAIFRAAHSIKGGSGTFGFTDMTEVTHELESLLDRARKHDLDLTVEMVDALLAAGDILKGQLAVHRGQTTESPGDIAACCANIRALTKAGIRARENPASLEAVPSSIVSANALMVPADEDFGFFDDAPGAPVTADAGFGLFADSPGHPEPAVASESQGYGFFEPLPASPDADSTAPERRTEQRGRRVTDRESPEAATTGRREADRSGAAASAEMSSIRVGVEKVDQLINLVGELVITQAMLAQTVSGTDVAIDSPLANGMAQLQRNTRDLQEAVMSIRMMPISFVFNRFPRVVRDLAAKLGKQVTLKTVGEGTEIDKGLIEKLSDPLTHLVRNSLDHGIETPDIRTAKGKPAQGTITLHAFHQGGSIIIEISDDGGGLNRQRILDKAAERGLPLHDRMSDKDVWQLIFEAGFSTAAVVTDVSGRGVGMDVVKRNIQALGGRVDIESIEGWGTKISIRLPLTLAILDGMSIAVGDELYILPLTCIVESIQPKESDIKPMAGHGMVIEVRGEYLPIVALHDFFNIEPASKTMTEGILVVVEANGTKTALFVDTLIGQHQVVIKSLETNYRKVKGISGATIMGDGRVAMIIDAAALTDVTARRAASNLPAFRQ